ncbi:hypothetical protein Aperf_G00000101657 [Anoplocephala perfoliata]
MSKIGKGFQIGLSWMPLYQKEVPPNAIEVDRGIYVARAFFSDEWIPGKYVASCQTCYIPYGGMEYALSECEILCDTSIQGDKSCFEWKDAEGGEVPKKAIVAGIASDGQPLFICMGSVGGETCVGKVHFGHSCGYLPYGGKEHRTESYSVLCLRKGRV